MFQFVSVSLLKPELISLYNVPVTGEGEKEEAPPPVQVTSLT